MGINQVPERNCLWGSGVFASEYIKRHTSKKCFEQVLRAFHWIDTTKVSKSQQAIDNKKDHFWRIQEFVGSVLLSLCVCVCVAICYNRHLSYSRCREAVN